MDYKLSSEEIAKIIEQAYALMSDVQLNQIVYPPYYEANKLDYCYLKFSEATILKSKFEFLLSYFKLSSDVKSIYIPESAYTKTGFQGETFLPEDMEHIISDLIDSLHILKSEIDNIETETGTRFWRKSILVRKGYRKIETSAKTVEEQKNKDAITLIFSTLRGELFEMGNTQLASVINSLTGFSEEKIRQKLSTPKYSREIYLKSIAALEKLLSQFHTDLPEEK